MSSVDLRHGAATHVGHVRRVNEDSHLVAPPVFVVADGMGGHDGGDVASALVVEEFARLARTGYDPARGADALTGTLHRAQQRIEEYAVGQRAAGKPDFQSGTTAVAAILVEDDGRPAWLLANVGDSRAYRVSDGQAVQVSVDHSLVQELLDSGSIAAAEADVHPGRHVVTRALGGEELPQPDLFLLPVRDAERLLLCSDGVSGMLAPDELGRILVEVADPGDAADRLIAAALAAGGEDNATAVVVDVVRLVHEDGSTASMSDAHRRGTPA